MKKIVIKDVRHMRSHKGESFHASIDILLINFYNEFAFVLKTVQTMNEFAMFT